MEFLRCVCSCSLAVGPAFGPAVGPVVGQQSVQQSDQQSVQLVDIRLSMEVISVISSVAQSTFI